VDFTNLDFDLLQLGFRNDYALQSVDLSSMRHLDFAL